MNLQEFYELTQLLLTSDAPNRSARILSRAVYKVLKNMDKSEEALPNELFESCMNMIQFLDKQDMLKYSDEAEVRSELEFPISMILNHYGYEAQNAAGKKGTVLLNELSSIVKKHIDKENYIVPEIILDILFKLCEDWDVEEIPDNYDGTIISHVMIYILDHFISTYSSFIEEWRYGGNWIKTTLSISVKIVSQLNQEDKGLFISTVQNFCTHLLGMIKESFDDLPDEEEYRDQIIEDNKRYYSIFHIFTFFTFLGPALSILDDVEFVKDEFLSIEWDEYKVFCFSYVIAENYIPDTFKTLNVLAVLESIQALNINGKGPKRFNTLVKQIQVELGVSEETLDYPDKLPSTLKEVFELAVKLDIAERLDLDVELIKQKGEVHLSDFDVNRYNYNDEAWLTDEDITYIREFEYDSLSKSDEDENRRTILWPDEVNLHSCDTIGGESGDFFIVDEQWVGSTGEPAVLKIDHSQGLIEACSDSVAAHLGKAIIEIWAEENGCYGEIVDLVSSKAWCKKV
jgi:hypothetical protein